MEVYESETREILKRFREGRITRQACIAALDAAVAGLVPRLNAADLPPLRALLGTNNEALMKEAKRRKPSPKVNLN